MQEERLVFQYRLSISLTLQKHYFIYSLFIVKLNFLFTVSIMLGESESRNFIRAFFLEVKKFIVTNEAKCYEINRT